MTAAAARSCSVNEVCDPRFGIDTKVEVKGTELGVLRHHHQRDDFLSLDDEKFEAVLLVILPLPTSFESALPTLAAVTKRSILKLGKFSLAVFASAEIFLSVGVIEAASPLPILLWCFARGRIGVETEILLALTGDELGPAPLAEYYRQPLKAHPLLLRGELIESPFDVGSQNGHSNPALTKGRRPAHASA